MSYIVDNIQQRGTSHDICEDTSLSFIYNENPYGVVSDGCSSESNSHLISSFICSYYNKMIKTLGNAGINVQTMESETSSLLLDKPTYATFIYSYLHGNSIRITIVGDGTIFYKKKGCDYTTILNFDQANMPLYPEYSFNRFSESKHLVSDISTNVNRTTVNGSPIIQKSKEVNAINGFGGSLTYDFSIDDYEIIGFCSDGVDTFINNDNKEIENVEIIKSLCDIKVRNDNFLKRKMNILNRKGYKHTDDFSCVMFLNKDDQ